MVEQFRRYNFLYTYWLYMSGSQAFSARTPDLKQNIPVNLTYIEIKLQNAVRWHTRNERGSL